MASVYAFAASLNWPAVRRALARFTSGRYPGGYSSPPPPAGSALAPYIIADIIGATSVVTLSRMAEQRWWKETGMEDEQVKVLMGAKLSNTSLLIGVHSRKEL